jgi:hypothetical protein
MGAIIVKEGELLVVRITGLLRKPELDAIQARGKAEWESGSRVLVLVIVEGFLGWDRGGDWGDMSFSAVYGQRIDKIAIVAEPKWEAQLLMFTGAGLRRTPVRFFPPDQEVRARAWLAEAPPVHMEAGS